MSILVLCPFVHRPSFEKMWATLDPTLRDHALVLDNTVANRGAAGSRNVGARLLAQHGLDWLVDVSPVTRFGPPGGRDFVELLTEHQDAWVVQSSTPVNWHLMAWSRHVFDRVGLFDENAHPIYGEDYDFSRRVHLAAREDALAHDGDRPEIWPCVDVNAWITMHGHSVKLANVEVNMRRTWDYMARKWGGPQGSETFDRPFGHRALGWWPVPPHTWAVSHEGWSAGG